MQPIAKGALPALQAAPACAQVEGADLAAINDLAGPLQELVDDLPEQIAMLDLAGTILFANRAWIKTAEKYGYLGALPGCNYRSFCADKAAAGYKPASHAVEALNHIAAGKRSFWQLAYNGEERWEGRDFQISFRRWELGSQTLILVVRSDLAEILELRGVQDKLAYSFQEGRADERSRMARELHDSTAQVLTGAKLVLGRLRREADPGRCDQLFEEADELLSEVQRDIRSIAYLAVPAGLEHGLVPALESFVGGFGRRTGIAASFDIRGEATPVPAPTAIAFVRIAQEALENVYRHARAEHVQVSLCFRSYASHLVIADDGVGISNGKFSGNSAYGVGLTSMRCRMTELRGRLIASRKEKGTTIIATVPANIPRQVLSSAN